MYMLYACIQNTHTHTCSYTSPSYQHYHHNSHIHRVSFPNGIFIHVEGPFTIFGVCVYIVCECNVCVNMCVTPSSNLAPYSNHITGHTHALTLTHTHTPTHSHTHSHVFAHRMSRPFPSLPPPPLSSQDMLDSLSNVYGSLKEEDLWCERESCKASLSYYQSHPAFSRYMYTVHCAQGTLKRDNLSKQDTFPAQSSTLSTPEVETPH